MLRRSLFFALCAVLFAAAPALCALTWTPNWVASDPVDPAAGPFPLYVTVTADAAGAEIDFVEMIYPGSANEFSLGAVTDFNGTPLEYPYSLSPDESFDIELLFQPSTPSAGATFDCELAITYDGVEILPIVLSVGHLGDLTVSTASVAFGDITEGSVSDPPRVVTIDNNSTSDVAIAPFGTTGASQFQVTATPSLPTTLQPGEQLSLSVVLDASTAAVGTYNGSVTFNYTVNDEPRTVVVAFSGSVISDGGGGGGGGGGTTEEEISGSEGLFIGPCFLGAFHF